MHSGSSSRKKTRVVGNMIHVGFNKSRSTRHGNSPNRTTTIASTSSKRGAPIISVLDKTPITPVKHSVQVIDEDGIDVTPLPLLHSDLRRNVSNAIPDSSTGTPTEFLSQQASIYQTATIAASNFGGGPFTRSVFSTSQSVRSTSGSISEELVDTGEEISGLWPQTKLQYKQVEESDVVTEAHLDRTVTVNLTETPTFWLFEMIGVCVSSESEEADAVRNSNELYKELVRTRVGNDRYAERGMNTFNERPKMKVVQTTRITASDVGVMATNWDMYDTYQLLNEKQERERLEQEAAAADQAHQVEQAEASMTPDSRAVAAISPTTVAAAAAHTVSLLPKDTLYSGHEKTHSTLISMAQLTESLQATVVSNEDSLGEGSLSQPVPVISVTSSDDSIDHSRVLESEQLRQDLVIMERVVNMNTYQPRQAAYRDLPPVIDIDKEVDEGDKTTMAPLTELGPALNRLWAYHCPLTKGHNVSFITWNNSNPDIVAVGYGQFEFSKQKGGLVCCWSLKNPEYPERVYTCATGVTSLDFSTAHPNLLAVGLYDGTVAIYNVKNPDNDTILDSFKDLRVFDDEHESSGKHTNPVWQLKWIERDRGSGEDSTEVLISISTDGRITQWSIRKGFESYDLMRLKRVGPKSTAVHKSKKPEAFISKYAGGLCFDFSPKDSNIYLAGTEEGHIHKCSCSYNEQYLENYYAHTGPVYKIQWSPFCPDVFLSCSGDWSVRLWHQDHLQPIFTFHSSAKSVPDICWSPFSATVFTCVNEGAVEIWDLSQSTLDPIIINSPAKGIKLSTVSFAKTTQCILVGDNEGVVSVYQLSGISSPEPNQAEILTHIIEACLSSQLGVK